MKYICIKEFELPEYDADGFENGNYFTVEKGTVFEKTSESIIGGEIHLESNNKWIEISLDTLKEYFSEIDERMVVN